MKNDTATLNDLIKVLEDGKKFYEEAATKVTRPDLRALFNRMATTKAAIENELRIAVANRGEKPASDGTFAGAIHKGYSELRASLSTHKNDAYVAELEQFEDRILRAFRNAMKESEDPGVRTIAQRYMPDVSRDHEHMRELKQNKAA